MADTDFGSMIDNISAQYPRLEPHLRNADISWAPDPKNGSQLEFYPPWESENPTPGRANIQLFNRDMTADYLPKAVAGDMLHLLGSYDPQTGEPPDPTFRALKQRFAQTYTPEQHRINKEAYAMDKRDYGDVGNYDDWMERSRTDAYIRGHLFPDEQDNWRGFYTPQQMKLLELMRGHLMSAPGTQLQQSGPGLGLE